MKKTLSVLLVIAMMISVCFAFASCGSEKKDTNTTTTAANNDTTATAADTTAADTTAADTTGGEVDPTAADTDTTAAGIELGADFKIGFIFLHDQESTYDKNFMDAAREMQAFYGLSDDQVIFKIGVDESNECYDACAELADAGCKIVFADSFGHETYLIQAAKEFTDVQFCHATGTKAHTEKLANYHNAFASIYEGRYLAGIAAGMKLNEMISSGKITADKAVIGYVGAFNYAEVVSGMTSFFLGARSVCESATMKVQYTNSWFDIAAEREAALSLINAGCVLLSQHADSEGAPKACEEKGIPNVAYNVSTISIAPNTALISSKINWAPYLKLIVECVAKGEAIPVDYCGTIATGSVELTALNEAVAAAGTAEAIETAKQQFIAGTLKVYDTSKFTVNGAALTEYLADVDDLGDFQPETNVVHDGYFDESGASYRSAPFFDIKYIDGISE